jgi:hypothetical protein
VEPPTPTTYRTRRHPSPYQSPNVCIFWRIGEKNEITQPLGKTIFVYCQGPHERLSPQFPPAALPPFKNKSTNYIWGPGLCHAHAGTLKIVGIFEKGQLFRDKKKVRSTLIKRSKKRCPPPLLKPAERFVPVVKRPRRRSCARTQRHEPQKGPRAL